MGCMEWAQGMVKLLLEKGAKLETKDEEYGQMLLSWAAEYGHEAVVKLLLEKGAELGCCHGLHRMSMRKLLMSKVQTLWSVLSQIGEMDPKMAPSKNGSLKCSW